MRHDDGVDVDDAARIELERLCDAAVGVIEANRGVRSAGDPPDPDVHAALNAITGCLVAAGVERGVAARAVTRWYITRARGGGRVSIGECVAVELDPPYDTSRVEADLGHRGTRKLRRGRS